MILRTFLDIFPTEQEFLFFTRNNKILNQYRLVNSTLFSDIYNRISIYYKNYYFLDWNQKNEFLKYNVIDQLAKLVPVYFRWFEEKATPTYNAVHQASYFASQPEKDDSLTDDTSFYSSFSKNKGNLENETNQYLYKQDKLLELVKNLGRILFFIY